MAATSEIEGNPAAGDEGISEEDFFTEAEEAAAEILSLAKAWKALRLSRPAPPLGPGGTLSDLAYDVVSAPSSASASSSSTHSLRDHVVGGANQVYLFSWKIQPEVVKSELPGLCDCDKMVIFTENPFEFRDGSPMPDAVGLQTMLGDPDKGRVFRPYLANPKRMLHAKVNVEFFDDVVNVVVTSANLSSSHLGGSTSSSGSSGGTSTSGSSGGTSSSGSSGSSESGGGKEVVWSQSFERTPDGTPDGSPRTPTSEFDFGVSLGNFMTNTIVSSSLQHGSAERRAADAEAAAFVDQLKLYDFGAARGYFIFSVPGTRPIGDPRGSLNLTEQMAVIRTWEREQASPEEREQWDNDALVSVGTSYGYEKTEEALTSCLGRGRRALAGTFFVSREGPRTTEARRDNNFGFDKSKTIVVHPTMEEAEERDFEPRFAPDRRNVDALRDAEVLYRAFSDDSLCDEVQSHMKTTTLMDPSTGRISAVAVGSANNSLGAMGSINKDGVNMQTWNNEAMVLITPARLLAAAKYEALQRSGGAASTSTSTATATATATTTTTTTTAVASSSLLAVAAGVGSSSRSLATGNEAPVPTRFELWATNAPALPTLPPPPPGVTRIRVPVEHHLPPTKYAPGEESYSRVWEEASPEREDAKRQMTAAAAPAAAGNSGGGAQGKRGGAKKKGGGKKGAGGGKKGGGGGGGAAGAGGAGGGGEAGKRPVPTPASIGAPSKRPKGKGKENAPAGGAPSSAVATTTAAATEATAAAAAAAFGDADTFRAIYASGYWGTGHLYSGPQGGAAGDPAAGGGGGAAGGAAGAGAGGESVGGGGGS